MSGAQEERHIPSFEKIDYRVRPAKQIERKMIAESLGRLARYQSMDEYTYLGMGSIAFIDFSLFHRMLGIDKMISVEREGNVERATFNRPFDCIEIRAGNISDVLSTMIFDKPMIIWLDYDEKIKRWMFGDIKNCATKLPIGSVLLITINADSGLHPLKEFNAVKGRLGERFGRRYKPVDLAGDGYGDVLRKLFEDEIAACVHDRNRAQQDVDKVKITQWMNFSYKDGARMRTCGWLIDHKSGDSILEKCEMKKLSTYSGGSTPVVIAPPVLTPTEVRHLNAQLPCTGSTVPQCPGVIESERAAYSRLYRHFPAYFEVSEA